MKHISVFTLYLLVIFSKSSHAIKSVNLFEVFQLNEIFVSAAYENHGKARELMYSRLDSDEKNEFAAISEALQKSNNEKLSSVGNKICYLKGLKILCWSISTQNNQLALKVDGIKGLLPITTKNKQKLDSEIEKFISISEKKAKTTSLLFWGLIQNAKAGNSKSHDSIDPKTLITWIRYYLEIAKDISNEDILNVESYLKSSILKNKNKINCNKIVSNGKGPLEGFQFELININYERTIVKTTKPKTNNSYLIAMKNEPNQSYSLQYEQCRTTSCNASDIINDDEYYKIFSHSTREQVVQSTALPILEIFFIALCCYPEDKDKPTCKKEELQKDFEVQLENGSVK